MATDPLGKPVAAELSLAMVQRNLLDLFAGHAVALDEMFAGNKRQPAMRMMASCSFLYKPKTHGISQALLAEEARQQTRAREQTSQGRLDLGMNFITSQRNRPRSLHDVDVDDVLPDYKTLMNAGRYSEAESSPGWRRTVIRTTRPRA